MKLPGRLVFALALGLVALQSNAQQSNPYNGSWLATLNNDRGVPEQYEVVVTELTGTWRATQLRAKNPCRGLTMPVAVTSATATDFEFSINGSKVLSGCSDLTVSVKRTNDKMMEGQVNDGRKITLVR